MDLQLMKLMKGRRRKNMSRGIKHENGKRKVIMEKKHHGEGEGAQTF